MQSSTKIDWFTGVRHFAQAHPFPLDAAGFTFVQCSGWSGYDVGSRELDTDIKRYTSTTRADMGFALLASASALGKLQSMYPTLHMLETLWNTGFREYSATRLDLAVDLFDGGELAHKVARSARRQVIRSKARQVSVIEKVTGGDGITTYLGSRGSTRFIRVYDKNAESDGKVPTSRFEIQCNKAFAAQCWRDIKSPTQANLNTVTYAAINGLVSDWGDESVNKELQFILSAVPPPQAPPPDDAWLWLSKSVLPTLQRDFYLQDDKRRTLIARLLEAIERPE